jgi:restriction system protein
MAEITVRRVGELMRGVFRILAAEPQGLPAREVLARLAKLVPPTDFEASTYPKNPTVRRYEKIVRFSSVTFVKAGWLVKDKGQWTIPEEGHLAFERVKDPEQFTREARRLYREWRSKNPVQPEAEVEEAEETVGENSSEAGATLEEAEDAAWEEIDRHLRRLDPFAFQELVAGLLEGMGYHLAWVAPPGPDRGLDILAHTDPLGVKGPRIKVQVKRREDHVDAASLRGFLSLLEDGDVGVYVAKGGFTRDAELEARQSRRRIMLFDAKRLFDLWVEHYDAVPEERRRHLPLKAVHYLLPPE